MKTASARRRNHSGQVHGHWICSLSQTYRDAAAAKVRAFSWKIESETEADIVVKTSINLLAFAEGANMRFARGLSASISSKCKLSTLGVDRASNEK